MMRKTALRLFALLLAAFAFVLASPARRAEAGDCFLQCQNGHPYVCCELKPGHVTCVERSGTC